MKMFILEGETAPYAVRNNIGQEKHIRITPHYIDIR
jgi:hypothetical protein